MMWSVLLIAAFASTAFANDAFDGCLFDGRVYTAGDVVVIPTCLGEMECLGHNNYSPIRPATNCRASREVNGQTGCYFDGRVYGAGEVITIQKCLAQMTCLGNNNYGNLNQLYGICPES